MIKSSTSVVLILNNTNFLVFQSVAIEYVKINISGELMRDEAICNLV